VPKKAFKLKRGTVLKKASKTASGPKPKGNPNLKVVPQPKKALRIPGTGLEFPIDVAEQWDGFNDPGIEHFSGMPYAALGREVPQNVIDATSTEPAKIVARLIEVPTDSIPDVAAFKAALRGCRKAAEDESEKAKIFFDQAIEIIERPKIKILQIEDYNTTGVRGPCENGFPYYALLKASGQSKKSRNTAIGSFGIGKYAPFVSSGLRTVFISTVWHDDKGWHHYVQGKSIWMSRRDDDGRIRRGVGFWGIKEKCFPVEGVDERLPDWLLRTSNNNTELSQVAGTTLSILGFDAVKGWRQQLAAAIAENFFGAIERGRLEVDIDSAINLRKETLPEIFADPEVQELISDQKGEPEKFQNSRLFLEAISSENKEVIVEQTQNQHLGNCELRILVREDLPKKIAILRDGMLITQELEKLRRFGDFKEFVAVIECQSKSGNALLRAMEPPRHDDFEPDRLPTEREKRKGRIALRELSEWVRTMLKRHAQDPVSEVTSIDELRDFFADDAEEGSEGRQDEENPAGKVIIRARPLKKRDEGGAFAITNGGLDDFDLGEGKGDGESEGDGEGGGGGRGNEENESDGGDGGQNGGSSGSSEIKNTPARVMLLNVRSVPLDRRRRRIAFTPDYSGEIRIAVQDSGADTNHKLKVVSATSGRISQGMIEGLAVTAGQRCVVDVELADEFDGAMRVAADAI